MKTGMIFRWAIILFIYTPVLLSCNKEQDSPTLVDKSLLGTWVQTVPGYPTGYRVYELTFNADGTFFDRSTSYGTYEGQRKDDLSGWFIRSGNYSVEDNKLIMVSTSAVSWDSFFGGSPQIDHSQGIIYENCTYTTHLNILVLNYITYPADGPVDTERTYIKK